MGLGVVVDNASDTDGMVDNVVAISSDFFAKEWAEAYVAYLHLENGKVPVYSANLWIESFAHTV